MQESPTKITEPGLSNLLSRQKREGELKGEAGQGAKAGVTGGKTYSGLRRKELTPWTWCFLTPNNSNPGGEMSEVDEKKDKKKSLGEIWRQKI